MTNRSINVDDTLNPLERAVSGYVGVSNAGPDSFAVGGFAREDPASVREFASEPDAVVNIQRARWIAREFHDWEIVSEAELIDRLLRGELSG